MDYTNYSIEDFVSDDSFVQWVNRSNDKAERRWDTVFAENPSLSLKMLQARTLVLNLRQAEKLSFPTEQVDDIWQGIEARIEESTVANQRIPRRSHAFLSGMAAAFCLLVIGVVGWYTLYHRSDEVETQALQAQVATDDFVEEVNNSGSMLRVHLSDGSTVALEDNSRLKYKRTYTDEPTRIVYLQGEAFFEVTRNPQQPFLVHANEVVTRVLGTSFWVKATDQDEDVVVAVKTGKVSVYALDPGEPDQESHKNAVILLPNQQVTYQRSQDTFGKSLVPAPVIISNSVKEVDFVFENTPINEVFSILEKAYGIEIIFDEEIMKSCFLTAPLGSEPLFEKLKIICRTIGARYETIDARVVISSAGC